MQEDLNEFVPPPGEDQSEALEYQSYIQSQADDLDRCVQEMAAIENIIALEPVMAATLASIPTLRRILEDKEVTRRKIRHNLGI